MFLFLLELSKDCDEKYRLNRIVIRECLTLGKYLDCSRETLFTRMRRIESVAPRRIYGGIRITSYGASDAPPTPWINKCPTLEVNFSMAVHGARLAEDLRR